MDNYIFLNGNLIQKQDAKLNVFDRGFLYGDGLFETLTAYSGNLFFVDEHLDRLFNSLKFFNYKLNFDKEYIVNSIKKSLGANNLLNSNAYIKIIVTRGIFLGSLDFDGSHEPNLIIISKHLTPYPKKYYSSGVKVITSSIKRSKCLNPIYRHKSINYLESLFAKDEAKRNDALEALFLTEDEMVLECSTSNIFMIKKEKIYTPSEEFNILPGITRKIVINLCAKIGIDIDETEINYSDLIKADSIFLTNSIMGILPVAILDKTSFTNPKKINILNKISKEFESLL